MVCFHSTGKGGEEFASEEERKQWDEEQKRLDREWYSMDQGYDDSSNPFSGTSEEYTKKKEEEFEQKKKKRMSEKQRQINKVGMFGLLHGMWIKTQQGGYVRLTAWNMNQITQKVQFTSDNTDILLIYLLLLLLFKKNNSSLKPILN